MGVNRLLQCAQMLVRPVKQCTAVVRFVFRSRKVTPVVCVAEFVGRHLTLELPLLAVRTEYQVYISCGKTFAGVLV